MFLSPEKLLVLIVVAVFVLGPDKLPRAAQQMASAWRLLQTWRMRLEAEARHVFPDLPPVDELSRAVRSPLRYLDELAGEGEGTASLEPSDATVGGRTSSADGVGGRRYDGPIDCGGST